ncbi:MAG: metalloregulator ArsR/SmtB family transcription factor [Hyphomicrobiales bacterium]
MSFETTTGNPVNLAASDQSPSSDCEMAVVLRALGHPARLQIMRALASKGRCFCGEIVDMLPLVQSTVSQHLKVLKDANLIEGTIDGPRSCYRLNTEKLNDASVLLGQLTVTSEAASVCSTNHDLT